MNNHLYNLKMRFTPVNPCNILCHSRMTLAFHPPFPLSCVIDVKPHQVTQKLNYVGFPISACTTAEPYSWNCTEFIQGESPSKLLFALKPGSPPPRALESLVGQPYIIHALKNVNITAAWKRHRGPS